jgi:hypothetical protein
MNVQRGIAKSCNRAMNVQRGIAKSCNRAMNVQRGIAKSCNGQNVVFSDKFSNFILAGFK